MDNENSLDFDSSKMMAAGNKNAIMAVSQKVIIRRTKNHLVTHFNKLETRLRMCSLLKERLLLTTTI